MADDRILTTYKIDLATGEITRMRIRGDEVLETKIVARYDAATQTVFFKNKDDVIKYKMGVVTFLSMDENAMPVRHFQREDLEPDQPMGKNTPKRPKKDNHSGDKNEAIVEWYMKNFPNEFETRYEVMGHYTGKVVTRIPIWEPRPKDGEPEFRGEQRVEKDVVNALVTKRKTHVSYMPEECIDWDPDAQGDEDYDTSEPVFVPAGRRAPASASLDDEDKEIRPGNRGGSPTSGDPKVVNKGGRPKKVVPATAATQEE